MYHDAPELSDVWTPSPSQKRVGKKRDPRVSEATTAAPDNYSPAPTSVDSLSSPSDLQLLAKSIAARDASESGIAQMNAKQRRKQKKNERRREKQALSRKGAQTIFSEIDSDLRQRSQGGVSSQSTARTRDAPMAVTAEGQLHASEQGSHSASLAVGAQVRAGSPGHFANQTIPLEDVSTWRIEGKEEAALEEEHAKAQTLVDEYYRCSRVEHWEFNIERKRELFSELDDMGVEMHFDSMTWDMDGIYGYSSGSIADPLKSIEILQEWQGMA